MAGRGFTRHFDTTCCFLPSDLHFLVLRGTYVMIPSVCFSFSCLARNLCAGSFRLILIFLSRAEPM